MVVVVRFLSAALGGQETSRPDAPTQIHMIEAPDLATESADGSDAGLCLVPFDGIPDEKNPVSTRILLETLTSERRAPGTGPRR